MIWSDARIEKFHVMNSITGRRPAIAAPTPTAAKPSSVIGVSTTRVAELLPEPTRHLIGAVVLGDLFAHDEDVLVSDYFLAERLIQRVADRVNC